MSDLESALRTARPPTRYLQWNIATLLLLMAAVGVWTAYYRMMSETNRIDAELVSLNRLARELVVDDPAQYAVVERPEQWYDEKSWEVHLPEGSRYQLKLATHNIGMKVSVRGVAVDNLPKTEHVATLSAGRHIIALEKMFSEETPSARLLVDGKVAIEAREPEDWKPQRGSSWGNDFNQSVQRPTDQPLELIRIRFRVCRPDGITVSPAEPYNGILVWIESEE